jgi:hypothetical protein
MDTTEYKKAESTRLLQGESRSLVPDPLHGSFQEPKETWEILSCSVSIGGC